MLTSLSNLKSSPQKRLGGGLQKRSFLSQDSEPDDDVPFVTLKGSIASFDRNPFKGKKSKWGSAKKKKLASSRTHTNLIEESAKQEHLPSIMEER